LLKDKQADIGQFVRIGIKLGTLYGTAVAETPMPLRDHDLAFLDFLDLGSQGSAISPVSLHGLVLGNEMVWLAFGILFATVITLLLVPSLYLILDDWQGLFRPTKNLQLETKVA
jgi:hypothetical protein